MKTKNIFCSCCGAEITMPQWYKGKPYGYTCITRVDPTFKRSDVVYVTCKVLKDTTANKNNPIHTLTVERGGDILEQVFVRLTSRNQIGNIKYVTMPENDWKKGKRGIMAKIL